MRTGVGDVSHPMPAIGLPFRFRWWIFIPFNFELQPSRSNLISAQLNKNNRQSFHFGRIILWISLMADWYTVCCFTEALGRDNHTEQNYKEELSSKDVKNVLWNADEWVWVNSKSSKCRNEWIDHGWDGDDEGWWWELRIWIIKIISGKSKKG